MLKHQFPLLICNRIENNSEAEETAANLQQT